MDGDNQLDDTATGESPEAVSTTASSHATVKDPGAQQPESDDGGEPAPIRDPAAPEIPTTEEETKAAGDADLPKPTEPEQESYPTGLYSATDEQTDPIEQGEGAAEAAPQNAGDETDISEFPIDGAGSEPTRDPAAPKYGSDVGDPTAPAIQDENEPERDPAAPQIHDTGDSKDPSAPEITEYHQQPTSSDDPVLNSDEAQPDQSDGLDIEYVVTEEISFLVPHDESQVRRESDFRDCAYNAMPEDSSSSPDFAGAPLSAAPRSAPPAAAGNKQAPSGGRDGANSADGGISVPVPAPSPGFRPYSETPVYSDPGVPEPPPPESPPPDAPCSGDWHRKTVDDLIAMDVPDVRIPRCVNTWGACEIRDWLRGLGLEQYTEALLNNGICGRRLCLLTASNLPRMGVTDWQHIRAITGSVRQLLSVDDYVPYERSFDRPPPGPMTRALYLQCARPSGQPPPSSARYRDFLRGHGFLDVLLELTNRPVVSIPQPQQLALYREIAVPPVPSLTSRPSQSGSPSP